MTHAQKARKADYCNVLAFENDELGGRLMRRMSVLSVGPPPPVSAFSTSPHSPSFGFKKGALPTIISSSRSSLLPCG